MLNVLRDTSALITVAAMGGSNVMVSIKGLPVEHAMPVEAASPALSFSSQDTIKDYLYYQTFLEQVAHHATRGDSQAAIELAVENLEDRTTPLIFRMRNLLLIANQSPTWQEAEPFRLRAEAEYTIAIKKCIKDRSLEDLRLLMAIRRELNDLDMSRLQGCVGALEQLQDNVGWYWEVALGLGESLEVVSSRSEESCVVEEEVDEDYRQEQSPSASQISRGQGRGTERKWKWSRFGVELRFWRRM